MALRTVGVRLTADVSQYMSNLRRAADSTRGFAGELDKAAQLGKLDAVADRAGAMGLALGGAFTYAVKAAADFDKAMSGVSAATHANAKDMEALRQAALQAGKDTQYSATEAAKGITELSKAGVATADVLNGGLKGALSLAAAGQIDVGDAAETAASAMTQFKLTGDKIPHVADLLAAAAGKAQGTVHDMSMALNQAGLVASQTGLSIEDTTGALAAFASAGLTGSDAGTSFKQMLLMLQAPTDKTRGTMEELGISAYDASGKFIGITALAGQLKDKMARLTPEVRANAMAQIFGADAVRGASILYEQGAEGIQKWIDKTNDAGYASETAARLTDNLAGDLEKLKSSVETLAISSGSGANSGLRVLVQGVNSLVSGFMSLPGPVTSTITVLAGLSGGALLLGAGWVKLRRSTAEVRAELVALGPAGEKTAAGLSKIAAAAGKATLVLAALQAANAVVGHFQSDLNPQLDALVVGLQRYASSGQLAGEASRLLGGDLHDLSTGFAVIADGDNNRRQALYHLQSGLEAIAPGLKGTNTSLARTAERIGALDQALSQMVQGGQTAQAKAAFDRLASALATGGVSLAEFRKQFPAYAAALEVAGKGSQATATKTGELSSALTDGADAQKKYATETEAATAAARGERDALVDLSSKLKAQTDPVFGLLDAEQSLTGTQRAAAKAIKEHGRNSDEAKEATRKLALAAIDLQEKTGALGNTFNGKMTPALRATLKAAGLTDAQIKDVAGQFRQAKTDGDKFAKKYPAEVSLRGLPTVKASLEDLLVAQEALKKGIPISAAQAAFDKNSRSFHAGGWTGPGPKYESAGVVHADEFVIRKESRRKIEASNPGLLNEMNATGQLPGYAAGGIVWPFPVTVARTRVPSRAEVASAVMPSFGAWPSSPGAQRGDSGIWRSIVAMIKATGPLSGSFGNAYRAGDPLWHGSGRAVDWMGYNQDALASFLAARHPLELIHRTNKRDYAYTRGRNMGSFNESLMNAHRNHVHIAMARGGTINEPVIGIGASGATYSFGENYQPERVVPTWQTGPTTGGGATTIQITVNVPPTANKAEVGRAVVDAIQSYERGSGKAWRT